MDNAASNQRTSGNLQILCTPNQSGNDFRMKKNKSAAAALRMVMRPRSSLSRLGFRLDQAQGGNDR